MSDGIVVTGLGLVTPLGPDVPTTWRRLLAGDDATGPVTRFPADAYRLQRACEVPARSAAGLVETIARRAVAEATDAAGLAAPPVRRGVVFGTLGSADLGRYERQVRDTGDERVDSATARGLMPSTVAAELAVAVGCEGPVTTVLTACASGNHAIAIARRWLARGRADQVVVAAADIVSQTQYTHFHNLRALAPDACRPFDRGRRGLVLGEGAAAMVLEPEGHARRRGASILARILGTGASADAFHMTAPAPDGAGARRAIEAALTDAGIAPTQVDWVSAHGTGTPHNDRVEAGVLRDLFGPRVPASAIKSMIGHCMGAASLIEAVTCVLAVRDGAVPPTIHFEEADPDCPIDCVPNDARDLPVRVAVNNAFAFGGNNGIVVVGSHA